MTYTSQCDFYVAIQDAGINRMIRHLMLQRPLFFNYGSVLPVTNPSPVCLPILTTPEVEQANNPLITTEPKLPLISLAYANVNDPSFDFVINQIPFFDFIAQVGQCEIDFFPENIISLPPDMGSSFAAQQFAMTVSASVGLVCPPQGEGTNLNCFSLDLFVTGECGILTTPGGQQSIGMNVLDIEIPALQPEGLMGAMKCYALYTINRSMLPLVAQTISRFIFSPIALPSNLGALQISASTQVPDNPAVLDNQLEAFIDLDSVTLNLSGLGGSGNGSSGGTTVRTTRPRQRTGTFDFTAAVSAGTLERIFQAVEQGFQFSKSGSTNYGPITVSYDVAAHLEGGSLSMQDNGPNAPGTIVVKNLVVVWDKLSLTLGFQFPNLCVGGGSVCTLPPWPDCDPPTGCASWPVDFCVTLPQFCLFSGNPELDFTIDLGGGWLASEATVGAELFVYYGIGSGIPNQWQLVPVPALPFALDIIDFSYTMSVLEGVVQNAIDDLLNSLDVPDWAIQAFNDLLGDITNVITNILNIPYDLEQWFTEMLTQTGIFDSILQEIYKYLSLNLSAYKIIDDPFSVTGLSPANITLVPVKIPIDFIGIQVTPAEIVIEGDVGDP